MNSDLYQIDFSKDEAGPELVYGKSPLAFHALIIVFSYNRIRKLIKQKPFSHIIAHTRFLSNNVTIETQLHEYYPGYFTTMPIPLPYPNSNFVEIWFTVSTENEVLYDSFFGKNYCLDLSAFSKKGKRNFSPFGEIVSEVDYFDSGDDSCTEYGCSETYYSANGMILYKYSNHYHNMSCSERIEVFQYKDNQELLRKIIVDLRDKHISIEDHL
jgi:hypothetical protein